MILDEPDSYMHWENKALMAATDFEKSSFKRRDADLHEIDKKIVKLTRTNLSTLAEYDITAAKLRI